MDATMGTDPPRLVRLLAKFRCITCVVLEHANVSYSSLRHDGGHIWQMRHDWRHGASRRSWGNCRTWIARRSY